MSAVVLGGEAPTPPLADAGSQPFWDYVGGNVGNLLYFHAAAHFLDLPTVVVPHGRNINLGDDVLAAARVVIKPTANMLRPAEEYEADLSNVGNTRWMRDLADTLRPTPLLLTSLGLEMEDPEAADLHPEQLEMLRALAANCSLLPLRGQATAGLLRRHAVFGGRVVGCPSQFLAPPATGRAIASLDAAAAFRAGAFLAVCLPPHFQQLERAHPQLAAFFRGLLAAPQARVIAQTRGDVDVAEAHGTPVLLFNSARQWLRELQGAAAVVSGRIHGSLAAVTAGLPVLTFATSERVRELAAAAGLPTEPLDHPELGRSEPEHAAAWAQRLWRDRGAAFDEARAALATGACQALASLGLPPSPNLAALAIADSTAPPPTARQALLAEARQALAATDPAAAAFNDHGLLAYLTRQRVAARTLPPGFDVATYARLNSDLRPDGAEALTDHFLQHGRAEGRAYRLRPLPPHFQPAVYRRLNPDLDTASDDYCEWHFAAYGADAGRPWRSDDVA